MALWQSGFHGGVVGYEGKDILAAAITGATRDHVVMQLHRPLKGIAGFPPDHITST
jgi:hypothetical protein